MLRHSILVAAMAFAVTGCEPVSLTLLGVGASIGAGYTLNGIAYKTFTAPIGEVRTASIKALGRMGISVTSKDINEQGEEVIKADTTDRNIEITLEPISTQTTRIRTIARQDKFLMDRATATEIIIQTERVLAGA
jgi:hypothetical protein